jgi:hypothetical protein
VEDVGRDAPILMQNPAIRRSLFQSTGDIQVRENLVIGINVRFAVGRKENWVDISP